MYCFHFLGGKIKLLEHKAHDLRMFILQLRKSVDFLQRPWNILEDGIGLYHMQIVCYNLEWIHFFSTWASGVHYANVVMKRY